MEIQIKPRQIWRNKATGELVKVLKVGSTLIRVQHREGSSYGKEEDIEKYILQNKYILFKNA